MIDCGMCSATAVLGDKWMLLIIREAFYGVIRFADIQQDIGIPRAVLSSRLKKLVDHRILFKDNYREEGARARAGYRLTKKGHDLAPLFMVLMEWGDKYYQDDVPAIEIIEKLHKQPLRVAIIEKMDSIKTYNPSEISFRLNSKLKNDNN
jgi:DNA-binding HxlR family transcriptional regulator